VKRLALCWIHRRNVTQFQVPEGVRDFFTGKDEEQQAQLLQRVFFSYFLLLPRNMSDIVILWIFLSFLFFLSTSQCMGL